MQNAKETASNIAASAKAGMDKTKAVVQEKVEKMTAHDPIEKDMATQRKEEKITQAEINKQQTREHNASATTGPGHATGVPGTGGMHMPGHGTGHILGGHETTGTGGTYGHSAMPGHHGTGHTLGGHGFEGDHLNDTQAGLNSGTHASGFGAGTGATHGTGHGLGGRVVDGIEKATGIGSGTTGHNTHGTHPSGYGTGGTYGHSAMPGHHGTGHTLGGHGFEGDHLNDTQAGLNSGTHASGFGAGTGGTHGTGQTLGGRVVEGIEKSTGIGGGTTGHQTHGTHPSGYGTGGTYN